jgi:hypothetical protein
VTPYCPKSYPVAIYPSVDEWYWAPTGFYQENPAFAIAELFELRHEWGVELEVNCLTVAASKQYEVNVNVEK